MKVCVVGLSHQGVVTAVCLAAFGHDVVAFDPDPDRMQAFASGVMPLGEPGLAVLVSEQVASGRLRTCLDISQAFKATQLLWCAFDTPIDRRDQPDVEPILTAITSIFPYLESQTTVVISAQLPVGSTRTLEAEYQRVHCGRPVEFAYVAENLRVGNALATFRSPERIVVGTRNGASDAIRELFGPLADRIIWMRTESAEMSKHALNAFLATSVALINEIGGLCESTGADVREVSQALRSDRRIGAHAYVQPGTAYAGGTLARDVEYLRSTGTRSGTPTHLLDGVAASNGHHRSWPRRQIEIAFETVADRRIAVWGLTYKPGAAGTQRSDGIALCNDLAGAGARVAAHDPSVADRPALLVPAVDICESALDAAADADALVIMTPSAEYAAIPVEALLDVMRGRVIVDPNGVCLALAGDSTVRYFSVGRRSR